MDFIMGECNDDDCTLNHDPKFKAAGSAVLIQPFLGELSMAFCGLIAWACALYAECRAANERETSQSGQCPMHGFYYW